MPRTSVEKKFGEVRRSSRRTTPANFGGGVYNTPPPQRSSRLGKFAAQKFATDENETGQGKEGERIDQQNTQCVFFLIRRRDRCWF
jgi:hypothetical protein